MKKILNIIFLLMTSVAAGQNVEFTKENFKDNKDGLKEAKNYINIGDNYFQQDSFYFKQAIDPYLMANKFNPNNAMLNFKIGKCYLYSNRKLKSIPFLEKALQLDPNVQVQIHYMLGKAYHLDRQWDKALAELKLFSNQLTNVALYKDLMIEVDKQIAECITGKDLEKNPARVFIDNVGDAINSSYPEYGPVITADESVLMFTSRRPGSTGGLRDESSNEYFEDIYFSTKVNDKWTPALNIGPPINTKHHDATMGLSADGQILYIYVDDKGDGNIYECNLKGTTWSKPEKLNKNVNTDKHESSSSLSADGKTLYFVSNRGDGFGDKDIWVSNKDEKGKWGKAENLGPIINTPYGEEGVFIHPDGKTMYFSSQGHSTMGGYDIFKSVKENGKWSVPVNLGYPVNTPDDDVFFVMAANGRHGYYSSFNSTGFGEKDIYMITFLGPEKPMDFRITVIC